MKKIATSILLFISLIAHSQNVFIPDANFKNILVANTSINTNGDSEIQLTEAGNYTGSMYLGSSGISDLTGIEAFTSISYLDCSNNSLTTLDLSANTLLFDLNCSQNLLTTLDLSSDTSLFWMDCSFNQLSNLTLLCPTLFSLRCNNNLLSSINLTSLTSLSELWCSYNLLINLDVSNNTSLQSLYCDNNQLSTLITGSASLTNIHCDYNSLTSLNLSGNLSLQVLYCNNNSLNTLNVNGLTALTDLVCGFNQLSSIDISTNTALLVFDCAGNSLSSLNVSNNTQITDLWCNGNSLNALDVSSNLALEILACGFNSLTSLDLTANSAIKTLDCATSTISSLLLPPVIENINCSYSALINLNLSNCTALKFLNCRENPLTSIDLSSNPALGVFDIFNCSQLTSLKIHNGNNSLLTSFDTRGCSSLTCIEVDDVPFMNSHFSSTIDSFSVFSLSCFGLEPIMGYTYKDMNSNCTRGAGDNAVCNVRMKLFDSGNNLTHQVFSQHDGFFRLNVNTGVYKLLLDTLGTPYSVQCLQPGIDTTLSTSLTDTTNFDLVCKPGFDLSVHSIVPIGSVFPGQQHLLRINAGDASQWNNMHCASGIGGTVTLTIDGPVTYLGAAPGALVPLISGNIYTYSITDFGTIQNLSALGLLLNTNTGAVSTDTICITVNITPSSGTETNTFNNTLHLCYGVRNSLDPNTKETYPTLVRPGYNDFFNYQVNFQNTGTAQAFTIRVVDTLASNLDLNTFELLAFSHPCAVSIDGNVLTALFENINLADSATNEAASHGYFQYRIKPLASQTLGTQIINTAFIYFDFNPAVATNTTVNHFSVVTSIREFTDNEISVFPNPSQGFITVLSNSAKDQKVKLFNVLGNLIYEAHVQIDRSSVIDLSAKAKGVYVLRIEDERRGVLIRKIVIE